MLKEIFIAFDSFGKAHRFVVKHRLWKWMVVPGIVYTVMFLVSMIIFWTVANNGINYLLQASGITAWLEQSDKPFFSFLLTLAALVFTLITLLAYFSIFKYIWLIIGSPVFAYLSEKTESIIDKKEFPFSWSQLWKDALRGMAIAARNALWQTVYTIAIFLLALVPVIGWAAPMLALFLECYYYGFSMLDYSCERHKMNPQESIRFIGRHKGLAIGNGIVFYLMHLVPIVGWLLAPGYAVISATISLYHQTDAAIK